MTRTPPRAGSQVDRLRAAHQQLADAVQQLLADHAWTQMLAVAARFPRYSATNVLMIMTQAPDASSVAGLTQWNRLGRRVRRGEKGIAIFAPCTYRPDPAHNRSLISDEVEAGDRAIPTRLRGFRITHVFDIAQTEGPDLGNLSPVQLHGAAPRGMWDALIRVATGDGYTVARHPCSAADGLTNYRAHEIRVRRDVDDAHAAVTLAHEIGHIRAEHHTRFADSYATSPRCRGLAEVEAESIAYLLSCATGLDATAAAVPYIAGWAHGDIQIVRDTADRVIRTARSILTDSGLLSIERILEPDASPAPPRPPAHDPPVVSR